MNFTIPMKRVHPALKAIAFCCSLVLISSAGLGEVQPFAVKLPKAKSKSESNIAPHVTLLKALDKALDQNPKKNLFAVTYTSVSNFGVDLRDVRHRLIYDVKRRLLIYLESADIPGKKPQKWWKVILGVRPRDWQKTGRFPKPIRDLTSAELQSNRPVYRVVNGDILAAESGFEEICKSAGIEYPDYPRLLKFP